MPTNDDAKGKSRKSDLPAPPPPPIEGAGTGALLPVDDGTVAIPPEGADDAGGWPGDDVEPPSEVAPTPADVPEQTQEYVSSQAEEILAGGPASYVTPQRRAIYLLAQHLNAVHAQMRKLATSLTAVAARGVGDPEMGTPHGKRSLHGRIDQQKMPR